MAKKKKKGKSRAMPVDPKPPRTLRQHFARLLKRLQKSRAESKANLARTLREQARDEAFLKTLG